MKRYLCILSVVLLSFSATAAQSMRTAFVGARIIPIVGEPIENGYLLVHNGKIVETGDATDRVFTADTVLVDVRGKVIMPGLVDTHSHIGEVAGADGSEPIQPEVRTLDSINARSASLQRAQAGGITVANIMPGSGHLDSGQTLYVKLRDGAVKIDDILIYDSDGRYMGGIKFANGTNSIRSSGKWPGTRAKSAALVREQFIKAQEYKAKIEKADGDESNLPARDLAMETLVEVLDGKRVIHHHTHRHDDILTVLRLQKEFGFRLVLQHVSEAWKVADEIAAAGVPSSIILVDSPGGKLETTDIKWENGAALEKAGAVVGFHTDDYITDSRLFFRQAGFAVRAGMSRDAALYGLTMAGAKMLDLEDRVGSLEKGKDADFIILSGDPLSVYTNVLETWVDGKKVFDRSDPDDYLLAVGGYGAGNDRIIHIDCFDGDIGGQHE
ncbi:MAG: amidohydrolase [Acidobacteria bacterium]|nr:MAG: amidohydrolase [Acidobacteriota bacterium]REK01274.1 MAG: amidohydrolase [Acidobacteriota bacterium]REK14230.1 MAG: amidohydrolase [Acidobacteriota bacterium]REK44945.1 MAG: amidohydrolase [Acidobacteriota bacterium]